MPSDVMIESDASGVPRPQRECPECHQIDDHPRHLRSDQDLDPHLDCCAAAGCPECAARIEGADGATGVDMLDHLLSNPPAAPDTTPEES